MSLTSDDPSTGAGASRTQPTLTVDTLPKNLFSARNFWSVLVQLAVFIVFFAGHIVLLNEQADWFCSAYNGIRWLEGERDGVPSACASTATTTRLSTSRTRSRARASGSLATSRSSRSLQR
ncbi:hypothetical protein PINS_up023917 [Pythium insidiosum]|nr:hypothetical protein PINS_up023917 [Pythium insidiosum]